MSPRSSALALTGVITPLLFTTLVVVQGFLNAGYSHMAMPISALAAWPTDWIQNLNCFVSGPLTIAFGITLHGAVRGSA